MKKVKKIIVSLLIIIALMIAVIAVSGATFFYVVTSSASLDETKLNNISSSAIEIYDINGKNIKPKNENYISISLLKSYTKDAFISAEDKRFYAHKGIDYVRIGGAIISNLKSHSFSQGASTISQQLVKNTQLSSEKTITRKLKEMKMTKELESKYSKDEILEFYLNNIYFGNGCYGIENASNHYFNKSAKDLTIAESALLAGTINAPSFYDIESNYEQANKRKDLILSLMNKYSKISDKEYVNAKNEKITLSIQKLNSNNFLYQEILSEISKKLNLSENEIKNANLKVYTSIDLNLQNKINEIIKTSYSNLESSPNIATIVIDNETNGIVAIYGSKSTLESKRQPGSTIKPILVYGPAIEENIVSPATKIIDEKINISGYSPENADKKYHGAVSVRTALKNSYNIPAVKLLNQVGITNAQNFAKNLGIEFSSKDNNLAIALGGFTDGIKLKSLCDAYTAFANDGYFAPSQYINKIVKNKKTIYKKDISRVSAMSDSTAYLITDMLLDTSTSGTAKRLKNFNFEIASKTGTVGVENSKKNTDAFNISYTNKHTVLTYFGGVKMPESINGATYPTLLTKDIFSNLYASFTPQNFVKPSSVVEKQISKSSYNKNILLITNDSSDSITEIFSKNNLPAKTDENKFEVEVFNFMSKKPIITFTKPNNYEYKIYRQKDKKLEIIDENSEQNIKVEFEDKTAKSDTIYEYFVVLYNKNTKKEIKSNVIKLKTFSDI